MTGTVLNALSAALNIYLWAEFGSQINLVVGALCALVAVMCAVVA